jgi:hypothetical protein
MSDLPTVVTAAGLQPQLPADLLAQLIAGPTATNPGYTANLPASLIEDLTSTEVAGLVLIDSARVELVNSLSPLTANEFLLVQLGQLYGVPQNQGTNTSVFVVFTGPAGFVISQGFTVSDGTNQYIIPDGGVIGTGGASPSLFAVSTQSGAFAVPQNTVTSIITSVPSSIALTVNNPLAGTPATGTQSAAGYRADVVQAGLAASQGMSRYLKTLLRNVPGVQNRLVSVRQVSTGWEVIVGGTADPYQVANAIFMSLFDVNTLVGSSLLVTGITNANPGVVTTNQNHLFTTGQVINILGVVGMAGINGVPLTITVISPTSFSIGIDTTALGTWTSGGIITPNLRNQLVYLIDYPDTYKIPIVIPPQQNVTMTVTWNTTATNPVSTSAVAQLAGPALINYVNNVIVGQPLNQMDMRDAFRNAISGIINPSLVDRLVFAVSINGIGTVPLAGTEIIVGDPESFFNASPTSMTIVQG